METYETFEEKPIIVPTKEHSALEAFIGKWAIEGENLAGSSIEANIEVKGIETYEWLPGGFFIVYKWDRYFGPENHIGIGIISHDESNHSFEINNYDNRGDIKTYKIVNEKCLWIFTGEKKRATFEFSTNGNSFTEIWEVLNDKENWSLLYKLKAKRIIS